MDPMLSGRNDDDNVMTSSAAAANGDRFDQPLGSVPLQTFPQASHFLGATIYRTDGNGIDEATYYSVAGSGPGPRRAETADAEAQIAIKGKEKHDGDEADAEAHAPFPPLKERSNSVKAIGPAQEDIRTTASAGADGGPICNITLLLTSGSRHPYKIDSKYLARRNVSVPGETEDGQPDPFSISIYTLKELILREWRNDWEAKPASPSSIRLIHFGKLLDDKEQLRRYQFGAENPNVIHMSIRPADLDEEEPKSGSNSHHGSNGYRPRSREGNRCCVIL